MVRLTCLRCLAKARGVRGPSSNAGPPEHHRPRADRKATEIASALGCSRGAAYKALNCQSALNIDP
jgi:hypothetical protein